MILNTHLEAERQSFLDDWEFFFSYDTFGSQTNNFFLSDRYKVIALSVVHPKLDVKDLAASIIRKILAEDDSDPFFVSDFNPI